jgi:hypothetical protein
MSAEDLRAPLVDALEKTASYLAIGNYGDPHVGFLVLCHADHAPTVVCITDAGTHALDKIDTQGGLTDEEKAEREAKEIRRYGSKRHFFSTEDLEEAQRALDGARYAMHGYGRKEDEPLGAFMARTIAEQWEKRAARSMEAALKAALEAARRAAECPHCHSRYSVRGLTTHLRRAPWCSRQEAARLAEAAS